jgi:hypothetical protein
MDCDDDSDAKDALFILRFSAGLHFAHAEGCVAPGG